MPILNQSNLLILNREVLSSVNLSQIKDVIAALQALVEKAEPQEDSVDDHSDEEKQSDDSADTKSDSEPRLMMNYKHSYTT